MNRNRQIVEDFETPLQKLIYWAMPIVYLIAIFITYYIQNCWISLFLAFFAIPYLDSFFDMDELNPNFNQQQILRRDQNYKYPVYCCVFFEWFFSILATNYFMYYDISYLNLFAYIIQISFLSSTNIITAHELIHKTSQFDQNLARLTCLRNNYTHFCLEHTKGHHQYVSTPRDASSAKYNQSIYSFFKQTIPGTFKSAIELEYERLEQKNLSVIHNDIYFMWIVQIFYNNFAFQIFGLKGGLFFVGTGIIGVFFLEIVNYIEVLDILIQNSKSQIFIHYGLMRKEISPGVYEKVTVMHSWNAPYRFSNALTFKLQRHSDHHENSFKEYQALCSYKESPLLPQSYPVLILMVLFPKLWFQAINPLIQSYNNSGKLEKNVEILSQKIVKGFLQKSGLVLTLISIVSFFI